MQRAWAVISVVVVGALFGACHHEDSSTADGRVDSRVDSSIVSDGAMRDGAALLDGAGLDGSISNAPCAAAAHGTGGDYGRAIAVDGAGNSYLTGSFSETAAFGSTTLTAQGSSDAFVAKLDSRCKFVWAIALHATTSAEAQAIALDSGGNVYLTGAFEGSLSCGARSIDSQGATDVFVVKLDPRGNLLWCNSGGSTDYDHANGIQIDSDGDAYITGDYSGDAAKFGSKTLSLQGNYDIFVAKLNQGGTFLWATAMGGGKEERSMGIAVDSSKHAYLAGFFLGSATFGETTLTSQGGREIFVAKLKTDGTVDWATSAGGTLDDLAYSIALDPAGGLMVAGAFDSKPATFGTANLTAQTSSDVFVAKLNASGSFQWAKAAGGNDTDSCHGIAVDATGQSYIVGNFRGSATFGSKTLSAEATYASNIFVAKLDPSGTFLWASAATGPGWNAGLDVAIDANGGSTITGFFGTTLSVGTHTLEAQGENTEVYAIKLGPDGSL